MIEILEEYRGTYLRHRAIAVDQYSLLDIDLVNFRLGHKPGINSAINKTVYFQAMLDDIYGGTVKLLGKYKNNKTRVSVHDGIGECLVLPKNLVKGVELNIRSARFPSLYFINLASIIHNNKYDYSTLIYKGVNKRVSIICPVHGKFLQSPMAHLKGSGCKLCGANTAFLSRTTYKSGIGNAMVYCLQMQEESGLKFYKIGFTEHSVAYRYHTKWNSSKNRVRMTYNYKIVFECAYTYDQARLIESTLHSKLGKYSYKPLKKFDGSATECYLKIKGYENYL